MLVCVGVVCRLLVCLVFVVVVVLGVVAIAVCSGDLSLVVALVVCGLVVWCCRCLFVCCRLV